jgi:hypothetical protein
MVSMNIERFLKGLNDRISRIQFVAACCASGEKGTADRGRDESA